jgi:hypothetical protein
LLTETRAIDRVDEETCAECGGVFKRLFGEVLAEGESRGIYSADLHREKGVPTAILTIMMGFPADDGTWAPLGVTCNLWMNAAGEFQLGLRDFPPKSRYYESELLGTLLAREEIINDPIKEEFFHVSDHICLNDRRLRTHFGLVDA